MKARRSAKVTCRVIREFLKGHVAVVDHLEFPQDASLNSHWIHAGTGVLDPVGCIMNFTFILETYRVDIEFKSTSSHLTLSIRLQLDI